MADYNVNVFREAMGYLVAIELNKVSIKAFPEIERAWQVNKMIQDLFPNALYTPGYTTDHCGLRVLVSDDTVRSLTKSTATDMCNDLAAWLGKKGREINAIAKFVEDKLNE